MLAIHILCSLVSYLAFLVAFVAGILFLIQERQVKRKTLGMLFHQLPSLAALDRLNFQAISFGFTLFSLGLFFGFLQIRLSFDRWWIWDPKIYLAVAVWVAYCALWFLRCRSTLRGRRVAVLSVLGFSLILFTLLETAQLLKSAHPYL